MRLGAFAGTVFLRPHLDASSILYHDALRSNPEGDESLLLGKNVREK